MGNEDGDPRQWCRGLLRRARGGQVRRRTAHVFPPELWNCYVRTLAGLPRTTNTCVAWHRRLTSLVGKHHPSFFVFLGQLRKEVAEIDIHITRAEGSTPPPSGRAVWSKLSSVFTALSTGTTSTRTPTTLSPT
ncbi:Peptide methionine sulfoxide reductase MsrB [Frankliniella fusca]|uniref:Peptide methionine sulfoxide reductase MsrB n=1 Tax=Frankliniella fusca TaxID=407009 RepID=A0AAE1HX91_9NEOP|nr:Peptide methionine sulfoxide reductase MsrB [Frankliniella fusca]